MSRVAALVAAGLHAAAALVCALAGWISVRADPVRADWDWYWQTVRLADLRERPIESLWHLHAQPPLFSALGALLLRIAPEGRLPEALHVVNVLLGAGMCAMAATLVARWTVSPRIGLVAGIVLALDPALLLYEAYPLYEVPTAFLVVAAIACLQRAVDRGSSDPPGRAVRWAAAAVGAVAALTLLRSSWHAVLLPCAVAAAMLAVAAADRRRLLLACALVVLPVLGWYGKNAVQHGFFGASSWGGQSLWRAASAAWSQDELRALAADGTIDPVTVEVGAFSPPSAYAGRGFDARPAVPSQARDDLHAASVPSISRRYGESAWTLVARDPLRFAGQVVRGYRTFCEPTVGYKHLRENRRRAPWLAGIYTATVTLGGLLGTAQPSVLVVLVPAVLVVTLLPAAREGGRSREAWAALLRRDAAIVLACVLVAWGVAAGSALEYGENERYEFEVEFALVALACAAAARTARILRSG